MQIRDINKPVNSKTLNETMAKKYGTKLNVDSFTLEQLQDARNKLRTKLSDIETNESFAGLSQNKTYSKNKLFLDVLNAAISERSEIDEGDIPAGLKAYQDKKAGKPAKDSPKGPDSKGSPDDIEGQDGADSSPDKDNKTKPEDKATKAKSKPKPVKETQSAAQKAAFKKMLDKKSGKKPVDKKPKDGKMPMDDNGTPGDKSDDKPAFLKKKNEAVIKEGTVKAVCKECGDTFGKPTTDCKNDCNDPTQDCWVKESDYMKESKHIDEGKSIINNYFTKLIEGEEDKAELVMASKDMVDRLTGWMEDTAEMQSESMLELADAIRDEMGAAQSETFTQTVKPALEQLYASMEQTRVALTTGVGQLTGEGETIEPMGDEPAMDADMEPTVDAEAPAEDDFGAAEAAMGGEDEAGRAKRESINLSRRLGTILSSRK